jgi:hypothetical protein
VEFVYRSQAHAGATDPDAVANDRVYQAVRQHIGPPYAAAAYLPRPADGLNFDLPPWRWGEIPTDFQRNLADWVKHYVEGYSRQALENEGLNDISIDSPIGAFTVSPRPIAQKLINELLANPMAFLGRLFGQGPGS